MVVLNPHAQSVSLDDLLKTNKDQFDKIFASQMGDVGLVDSTHRPPTRADLESASLQAQADSHAGDATELLNERFGSGWSSEIV